MLIKKQIARLDWKKMGGLLPVIVQSSISGEVLMLGYMNEKSLNTTIIKKKVTFFSRKTNSLWTKGEISGNYLKVVDIYPDCDNDSLLILAEPIGPTCHLKNSSCFKTRINNFNYIDYLEKILEERKNKGLCDSYTSYLYSKGTKRIAQKVGEESVETILAAVTKNKKELINESSDLLYHLLVLLHDQNLDFSTVISNLKKRNSSLIKI